MDFNRGTTPEAVVPARPTGPNGIPETFADDDMLNRGMDDGRGGMAHAETRRGADAYLPWVALGAVVAGGIGAITAWKRRPMRVQMPTHFTADPQNITPPHGDKLLRHD